MTPRSSSCKGSVIGKANSSKKPPAKRRVSALEKKVLAAVRWSGGTFPGIGQPDLNTEYGAPTSDFWDLWAEHKDKIKSWGIFCLKNDQTGKWFIKHRLDYTPKAKPPPIVIDHASIEASRALTADIPVPVPVGLDLFPYQKAAVAFALQRPHTLFGDAPGTGKSMEAIGTVNSLPDARSILIVCPAIAKINWSREWLKWDVKGLTVEVAKNPTLPTTDVVILTYHVLKKYKDQIQARAWDVLIADEVHKCSNYKAQMTQMLFGDYKTKIPPVQAGRKLFLTGTPISNRLTHLWPIVEALDPGGLGLSWARFMIDYAGGYKEDGYWMFDSARANLEELQARLRSSIMIRRTKDEVLPELPAKLRKVVEIEPEAAGLQKMLDREAKAWGKMFGSWEDCQESLRGLTDDGVPDLGEISTLRKKVAISKVPSVITHLEDALEEEDKVICFAHHTEVISKLMAHFKTAAVKVDGGMTPTARQASIDRFMIDPTCRLFIGSMTACGEAITLTASSHVVFAELDWLPKTILQAEDRAHRIGQKDSVLIEYLVWDGSLDARMAHLFIEKAEIHAQALDKRSAATT